VAILEAIRLFVYGSLVPNTFYAKPPHAPFGLVYVGKYLVEVFGVFGLFAVVPVLRKERTYLYIGGLALIMLLGTLWSGGDWMPGYRRLVMPTIASCWLAGMAAGFFHKRWWFRGLIACWIIGSLTTSLREKDGAFYYGDRMENVGLLFDQQEHINRIAIADIGRFGWGFSRSIFDLAGLTDAHIARQEGVIHQKEWDEEYFRNRSPEIALVFSSGTTAQDSLGMQHVRESDKAIYFSLRTHRGYYYHSHFPMSDTPDRAGNKHWIHIFVRDDITLDEEIFGPIEKILLPVLEKN